MQSTKLPGPSTPDGLPESTQLTRAAPGSFAPTFRRKSGLHARGEGERVLALESREYST